MNKDKKRLLFTRAEMLQMNIKTLRERGVEIEDIAQITFNQQARYTKDITMALCIESVEKVISLRDPFHFIQLAAEIDRLVEVGAFRSPMQEILHDDLGLFGIDETLGLDLAGLYGTIGQTNFGDIDVNKGGIISKLNSDGAKEGICHTFLDDIVGAIAAAASTRVAQVINEELAGLDESVEHISIFDLEEDL